MKPVAPIAAALLLAAPATAAAPPYDTPAPVAFLQDLSSGAVLYAKGADTRMPPASMAKMMTVYVAFDLIRRGELKLDQKLQVRPETWRRWHGPAAGSTMFLSPGEEVSVADLLSGIVTLSGNDACVVLAEGVAGTEPAFVNLMNQQAARIGLKGSHFGNSNGWPDGGATYVTARDLARLAEATIKDHPKLYKEFYSKPSFTWGKTMGAGAAITQGNRDPLLGRVAGADGLKTGHTEEAGYGFTGSAEQGGRRLVMVMAGLTSFNQRIEQSVAFMDWGFRAWRARPLFTKGKRVGTAKVQLGDATEVELIAPRDLALTVPVGASSATTMAVVYQGPVKAPFKAGDHIADLVVTSPDSGPQTLPLAAARDVGEAGFLDRLWAGLRGLFRDGVTPGRFITLEGGEGVGKSTQLGLLAGALRARGLDVVTSREPGGGDGAEAIRALLFEREWTAPAEALLFAAARAEHVATVIRPALAAGQWVLCDRFVDSSRAYQGEGRGIGDATVMALHGFGSGGLLPDRTLVCRLPPGEAAAREAARDGGAADRFSARGADYHARIRGCFETLAEQEPQRVRLIDADGPPERVTARLVEALADLLP